MAGPITWRNVGATVDASGVGSLFEGAQASFEKGIGALDKVLQQAKTTQEANWNQGKTNNNDQLMDSLYGYKTPEELANAQASGQFQQMMAGMGAQVDRAAFREALDSRGGQLQERAVATQGYQDHNTRVGQRELEAQMYQLAHSGDIQGAQAIASRLQIDQANHLNNVTGLRRDFDSDRRADSRLAIDQQSAANSTAESRLRIQAAQAALDETNFRKGLDAEVRGMWESGRDQELSTTQLQQAMISRLTELGAPTDYIQQAVSGVDGLNTVFHSPAGADAAALSRVDTAFNDLWKQEADTPYVRAQQNTASGVEQANKVVEWANESGLIGRAGSFFESEIDANNAVTSMLNTGFSYKMPDGSYKQVRVTDEIIQGALYNRPESNVWGAGNTRDLNELVQSYLESIDYADQMERGDRYIEAAREHNTNRDAYMFGRQLNQQ